MAADVPIVIQELRDAISHVPDGSPPPQIPFFLQWSKTGRHYLNEWITDLASALEDAEHSITSAEQSGLGAAGSRELEPALWRIDSAIDKLLKILALTLGVKVLALNKAKNGVRFNLDVGELLARLKSLAKAEPSAATLLDILNRLNEHPARKLRNEVSHSLSPVGQLTPLSHIAVVYFQGPHKQLPQARMLYTESVPLDMDMSPPAIWSRLIATARDGLALLLSAVDGAASVIERAGRLEPPTVVYYDLDTGRASF